MKALVGSGLSLDLLAVHVIYASRIVTRTFFNHEGTKDTKTRHWMGWLLCVHCAINRQSLCLR